MDGREAWLLREAARKRANVMGLHEWAEDIAQETVLRHLNSPHFRVEEYFFESVLFVVEKYALPPFRHLRLVH
jgi:DNA-directed RNA polymerase specialized sigma24 family protein